MRLRGGHNPSELYPVFNNYQIMIKRFAFLGLMRDGANRRVADGGALFRCVLLDFFLVHGVRMTDSLNRSTA